MMTTSGLVNSMKQGGDFNRSFFHGVFDTEMYFGTVDITGKFATGALEHTLLVGADYYYADYIRRIFKLIEK